MDIRRLLPIHERQQFLKCLAGRVSFAEFQQRQCQQRKSRPARQRFIRDSRRSDSVPQLGETLCLNRDVEQIECR